MPFIKMLNERREKAFNESFNTPVKIDRVVNIKGINGKYYYFNINDKEFRVMIESTDKDWDGPSDSHMLFEQKINDEFTINGVTNNLDPSEVLSLFSTLLKLVDSINTDQITIGTDSLKKYRLYNKLLNKSDKYNHQGSREFKGYVEIYGVKRKLNWIKSTFKFLNKYK